MSVDQKFLMSNGTVEVPQNMEPLTKWCQYFNCMSSTFSNWFQEKFIIDLSEFRTESMLFLLKIIYDNKDWTLMENIDQVQFISLCAYLMIDEGLLLKSLDLRPSFFADIKTSLTVIYRAHTSGLQKVSYALFHILRIPDEFLEKATSFKKFLKSIRSASKFHTYFVTKVQYWCRCDFCTEWKHQRSIHLFGGEDSQYPTPYFGPIKSLLP